MKIITLAAAAVLAGAVRYPVEGPLTVSDEEAERLLEAGQLACDPEDVPLPGDEDGLSRMTVAELKELAAAESIDLGDANRKQDIINAIRAHRAGDD